jgi:hypothetical protein
MTGCEVGLYTSKVVLGLNLVEFLLALSKDFVCFCLVPLDSGDIGLEPQKINAYVLYLPGVLCTIMNVGSDVVRWVTV